MTFRRHEFTETIVAILDEDHPGLGEDLLGSGPLLQYLNIKTIAASRGSKSRGSFGNLYAIYVLVEDYLQNGYDEREGYADYEGAVYTHLLDRQRQLPFGARLQNHALNHRANQEFARYFPLIPQVPIVRNPATSRYWINEELLVVNLDEAVNVARSIIRIIDAYVDAKTGAFNEFIDQCKRMRELSDEEPDGVKAFLASLLDPSVDARIFEVVSFAILRTFYGEQSVFIGPQVDQVAEEALTLYKTGRTNANDGGIDFVMRPLGRFFQVTEAVDVRKFFLDIDKLQHYPVTFVVKSEASAEEIRTSISAEAQSVFGVSSIVSRCMESIEEVINVPNLLERLDQIHEANELVDVIDEVVRQAHFEFHLVDETVAENET